MKRFWISWWTYHTNQIRTAPFQYWTTGHRLSDDKVSMCAVIDAPGKAEAKEKVLRQFGDARFRFADEKASGFQPDPKRFPMGGLT